MSPSQVDLGTLFLEVRIESIVTAKFSTDAFQVFKVDVPFMVMTNSSTRIETIAEKIGGELLIRQQGSFLMTDQYLISSGRKESVGIIRDERISWLP